MAKHNIDTSLTIKREDFEYLRGQLIHATDAERLYNINSENFSKWSRQGIIKRVATKGRAVLLDKADVAYCAAVYKAKYEFYDGKLAGVNIFDSEGRPYKLKSRKLADRRRKTRQKQRQEQKKTNN